METFDTYTSLRDFLDRYTNAEGVIQGDPATIAGEAATAGLVAKDEAFAVQIEQGEPEKGEPELDTDAQVYLDKRKRKGEKILRVAWGKRNELHEDDRLSAATDAISDVLTAMYGPAGLCLPPTGIFDNVSDVIADAQGVETWRVELDELRVKQARELLHHALGSWEGDAEDYTVEEG